MPSACPFHHATAPEHRADPYPLFAELPKAAVRLEDGRYLVTRYEDVVALLHDPRVSSAAQEGEGGYVNTSERINLLQLDPPDHDRVRRIIMRQFGPPERTHLVHDLEDEMVRIADALLDDMAGHNEAELVTSYAYRLPVAIICKLFGVPETLEAQFRDLVDVIVTGAGVMPRPPEVAEAQKKLGMLLLGIARERRGQGGDDILSGLIGDDGPEGGLSEPSIAAMAVLLLVAGHETTVNLIGNGLLTLLNRPEEIERLRRDPDRAIGLVEELLRFEPPIQFMQNRVTVAPVEVGEVTIPAGCRVVLLLAAANRDPARFADPDRFDPERTGNEHLGFGSGIHSCFGAALARMEGQVALQRFFARVENPVLAAPPVYRPSPLLRGPLELHVSYDAIRQAGKEGTQ